MKTLVVIRHAKSSWDNAGLHDFDRPLNDRGLRDAPRMGNLLAHSVSMPQVVVSSPAVRAYTTAKLIADAIEFPFEQIQKKEELYHANAEDILEMVKGISDQADTAFLFGHNPGLTDFVNELTEEKLENIPTCGIAVCKLKAKTWHEVTWGCGSLIQFEYPKKNN